MSFPVTGYQDIAASAMGGNASQTAPTYQQAGWKTVRQLGTNQYGRDQMNRDWARTQGNYGRQMERTARSLPGQYNQRGMLDSGVYQRGANQAIGDISRNYGQSFQDKNMAMENSYLQDDSLISSLSDLKGQLTSQQYQAMVSAVIKQAGGAA
tara:strand:+ start:256 stop:714 length:459 start_codon:yes stop_codon:yes gene_type:complete